MNGRTFALVIALALVCMTGIVGMLLAEGAWDRMFLALAALPLATGLWRGRMRTRAAHGNNA